MTHAAAQAVSVDAGSLIQRLDAIEQRISKVEGRRPATSDTPNIGGISSYSAADLEQRTTTLEEDTSRLRGTSDRTLKAMEDLAKHLDTYIKDMDMRLSDIEARIEKLATGPVGVVAPAAVGAAAVSATPVVAPKAVATPKTDIPADLPVAEHYNKAYAFLTATDYTNAEAWFVTFLKRHAADPLADNAYYWLGEVYLVQNNPKAAATQFRDGLKAFPKGSKAPANLYKMGVALQQMNQPKLAKAAWQKLLADFPKSQEAARAKDKLLTIKE